MRCDPSGDAGSAAAVPAPLLFRVALAAAGPKPPLAFGDAFTFDEAGALAGDGALALAAAALGAGAGASGAFFGVAAFGGRFGRACFFSFSVAACLTATSSRAPTNCARLAASDVLDEAAEVCALPTCTSSIAIALLSASSPAGISVPLRALGGVIGVGVPQPFPEGVRAAIGSLGLLVRERRHHDPRGVRCSGSGPPKVIDARESITSSPVHATSTPSPAARRRAIAPICASTGTSVSSGSSTTNDSLIRPHEPPSHVEGRREDGRQSSLSGCRRGGKAGTGRPSIM